MVAARRVVISLHHLIPLIQKLVHLQVLKKKLQYSFYKGEAPRITNESTFLEVRKFGVVTTSTLTVALDIGAEKEAASTQLFSSSSPNLPLSPSLSTKDPAFSHTPTIPPTLHTTSKLHDHRMQHGRRPPVNLHRP
jgi:hypothetical protein